MSPINTMYASAVSALAILTKDNPKIVYALSLGVLAKAAGVDLDKWLDFPGGREMIKLQRAERNVA